ncbi:hypothetical protein C8J57DRAFT_1247493 [Mycena rebaudengoi]|nr:hypothetical protein C8J57DRAFT_1247493 [Mycena rebaudengoi]
MSTFNILGFFQHKGALQVPTQNPNGAYAICSGSSKTLAEGTVVSALCKPQALPIPGDPSLDAYDDLMSNEFASFVPHKLQGSSIANHESASSGSSAPSAEPDVQLVILRLLPHPLPCPRNRLFRRQMLIVDLSAGFLQGQRIQAEF